MNYDKSLESIYDMAVGKFQQLFPTHKKNAATIYGNMQEVHVEYLKEELFHNNIFFTHVFEDEYPSLLKEIYDPPWILYGKGDQTILDHFQRLSVVGTRHPSAFIKHEMNVILSPIINKPLTIVSGMALGIDAMAHELTIRNQGKTIAVLAYGLNHLYPKSLNRLKDVMQQSQLVLTEYPPYVRPQRWHFPERNRIISGLSQATLVVEAKEKSGSLITSDCALQQNRDVFALPGRISQQQSIGTNRLIQQGAKIILNSDDILEEYP